MNGLFFRRFRRVPQINLQWCYFPFNRAAPVVRCILHSHLWRKSLCENQRNLRMKTLRVLPPSREAMLAALDHLQYVAEGAERFEDAGDLILVLPIRAHEATPQQLLQNQPHQD